MKIGKASESAMQSQALIQDNPEVDDNYTGQPEADLGGEGGDDLNNLMSASPLDMSVGAGTGLNIPIAPPQGGLNATVNNGYGQNLFGTPPVGGAPVFGQQPTEQTANNNKPDPFDVAFKVLGEGSKTSLNFFIEFFKSFLNRNIDDWAQIANTWLRIGGVLAVVGALITVVGTLGNIGLLKLGGIGGLALFSGGITFVGGCFGLGLSVYLKASGGDFTESGGDLNNFEEFNNTQEGGFGTMDDSESDNGYSFDDDDEDDDSYFEDLLASTGYTTDSSSDIDTMFDEPEKTDSESDNSKVDYNSLVDKVQSNVPVITKKFLWETFKPFFPLLNSRFSETKELDLMSETALSIGAGINQALTTLYPKDEPQDLEVKLVKVIESFYSYKVTFTRPKKKVKPKELADEITTMFRESPEDLSEVELVTIGTNFIATIPKGVTAATTLGDVFQTKQAEDFFLKKSYPFVAGIGPLGEIEMLDAKKITSMLIAGKPRSGKSSYVSCLILSLVMMNTPEDVQFLIIDPKDSMLFYTYALLPHVCGRHNDKEALKILDRVLNGEGERRKKLLHDNGVENIWELRERKNIKLPVLYVVIDEVVSLMSRAQSEGTAGQMQSLINSILTQLPSSGIGLIMIPHRSTGILSPTTRMNLAFKAAVMADIDAVKEELGVRNWTIPLTHPGEIAVNETGYQEPKFVRGPCVVDPSLPDADYRIRELICNIARTWYKMGVELPYMGALEFAANRDEEYIKEKLEITLNPDKVQYELNLDGYRTD